MNVLEVSNIKKCYKTKEIETMALDGVSFELSSGEFVGIMGASGSGKTTLLNCIALIDTITEGKIAINGADIGVIKEKEMARFRRKNLGFIFQDFKQIPSSNFRRAEAEVCLCKGNRHKPTFDFSG